MKKFKILLIVMSVLVLFYVAINIIPAKEYYPSNQWRSETTQISAHRGGAFLNPENTMKAFKYVIEEVDYVDIVELDIRVTKDNQYVIIHDETINRTALSTDAEEIKVADLTLEQLRTYNLGVNFVARDGSTPYKDYSLEEAAAAELVIITLEEFLDEFYDNTNFKLFLEIKDKGEAGIKAADYAIELINNPKYHDFASRTLIISFVDEVMNYIIETYQAQDVGPLGYKIVVFLATYMFGVNLFYTPDYPCLQVQPTQELGPLSFNLAKSSLVNKAHSRGMAVTYWTINDSEMMEHLIDIGADVITTNAPDVLYQVLNEKRG